MTAEASKNRSKKALKAESKRDSKRPSAEYLRRLDQELKNDPEVIAEIKEFRRAHPV